MLSLSMLVPQRGIRASRVLRKMGGVVSCGVTTGNIGTINIRKMYQKQLTVMGSALGTVPELRTLVHLAGQGKLEPLY